LERRSVTKVRLALRAHKAHGVERLEASAAGRKILDTMRVGRKRLAHERTVLKSLVGPQYFRLTVKHVHGPLDISYAPDELLVTTVVRNGALYVTSFIDHYLTLGAKHLVFLDNGSTDRTVEMLRQYDKVTVLRTGAAYQNYENIMKRYLANRFSCGRWNLCADIDELFDFPYSTNLRLNDFMRYLNVHGYTAVISQMLDMFSDQSLGELKSTVEDRLTEKYSYYDISNIRKTDYTWSEPANDRIMWHWGGIRETIFGSENSLTKAALVLIDRQVKTFVDWHHVEGARVADVSCVLKHYPFVGSFRTKVQDAVRTGRYGAKTTDEYVAYWKVLERDPHLNLKTPSAQHFTGTEELIKDEFLVVSAKYRQWVADRAGSHPEIEVRK
jgi:hypothetical protein